MPAKSRPSLANARRLLAAFDTLGRLHRQGHYWTQHTYLPCVRRLASASRRSDQKLAAKAFARLGDLHDLNGTPKAAVRAYQRSLKLAPRDVSAWYSIGCMLDNMGRYQQARHALMRAAALAPDDELLAGDLDRVEWAMVNPCPVLYDERNPLWHASEALAAGHFKQALALLGRRRTIRARQIRARVLATRAEAAATLDQWSAIAATRGKVQLQHADWYYTLRGRVADNAELWRLMLWRIRPKLEGGASYYSPSLAELDMTEAKRFELHARFELARCEADLPALLALATKYPSWREPGETALRLG